MIMRLSHIHAITVSTTSIASFAPTTMSKASASPGMASTCGSLIDLASGPVLNSPHLWWMLLVNHVMEQ